MCRKKCSTSLFLLIAALCGGALGCSGGLDTFDITEVATAKVPAGSVVEQLIADIGFGDAFLKMNVRDSEAFQNQGIEEDQIDSVRLASFEFRIVDPPSGQDFTFLDSLAFHASSEGLESKRIAHGGPFTTGANAVSMTVDGVELQPYVVAKSMDITTEATGKRPKQETTIEATMVLRVDFNVSGILF